MKKHSMMIWDLMAKQYSNQPLADEAAYQKKLQETRKYFRPDMDVLEFGSGTGSTAIAHAPYVKHILAIDGSKKMIEISKEKADAENITNIAFQQETINEFSIPDNTYDVVMGHSILHLLKNREEILTKVYKMLKPGGVFVSSTMCIGDDQKHMRFVAPIMRIVGLVLKVFTKEELKTNITNVGFKIGYEWQPDGKSRAVFFVAKKPA